MILLDDAHVQRFLRDGYITLQTDLPNDVHAQIRTHIDDLFQREGNPGNDILPKVPDLYRVLEDERLAGALTSLLGPEYIVHPHRHCHQNIAGSGGQSMHQDSYESDQNVRHHRCRWAMAFYYPQDVALENGPSSAIPATQHYNDTEQAHERAELPLVGPAGTVTIVHYDLWHRAMPNLSDTDRYMVKFLFTRLREPDSPAWHSTDGAWTGTDDGPPDALCQSQWQWMGGRADLRTAVDDPQLLYEHLQSAYERRRLDAAYALASQGADGVPYLVRALRTEATDKLQRNLERAHTNPSQLDALFALSAAGAPAIAPLEELLLDPNWALRAAAADALGDMGGVASGSISLLQQSLADDEVWVRRNATEALGHMGPEAVGAVPALAQRLSDRDATVRHNAALALAKIGPAAAGAVTDLKSAQQDEHLYVRENARIALQTITA